VDGVTHDAKTEYDSDRDALLESLGLVVIHIQVKDIMKNLRSVMDMLLSHPAL